MSTGLSPSLDHLGTIRTVNGTTSTRGGEGQEYRRLLIDSSPDLIRHPSPHLPPKANYLSTLFFLKKGNGPMTSQQQQQQQQGPQQRQQREREPEEEEPISGLFRGEQRGGGVDTRHFLTNSYGGDESSSLSSTTSSMRSGSTTSSRSTKRYSFRKAVSGLLRRRPRSQRKNKNSSSWHSLEEYSVDNHTNLSSRSGLMNDNNVAVIPEEEEDEEEMDSTADLANGSESTQIHSNNHRAAMNIITNTTSAEVLAASVSANLPTEPSTSSSSSSTPAAKSKVPPSILKPPSTTPNNKKLATKQNNSTVAVKVSSITKGGLHQKEGSTTTNNDFSSSRSVQIDPLGASDRSEGSVKRVTIQLPNSVESSEKSKQPETIPYLVIAQPKNNAPPQEQQSKTTAAATPQHPTSTTSTTSTSSSSNTSKKRKRSLRIEETAWHFPLVGFVVFVGLLCALVPFIRHAWFRSSTSSGLLSTAVLQPYPMMGFWIAAIVACGTAWTLRKRPQQTKWHDPLTGFVMSIALAIFAAHLLVDVRDTPLIQTGLNLINTNWIPYDSIPSLRNREWQRYPVFGFVGFVVWIFFTILLMRILPRNDSSRRTTQQTRRRTTQEHYPITGFLASVAITYLFTLLFRVLRTSKILKSSLDVPDYTLKSLQYSSSPQSLAYSWLLKHPDLTKLPDWRKQQLLALATIYYSLDGTKWTGVKDYWLDDERPECDWHWLFSESSAPAVSSKSAIRSACSARGRVHALSLNRLGPTARNIKPNLPPEIELLPSLETITISSFSSGTRMTATLEDLVPERLIHLTNLTLFHITNSGTGVHGTIPSRIGTLTTLQDLDLSGNSLSGSIPSELGILSRLTALSLAGNSLTGTLPKELFSRMTNLQRLDLSHNLLRGTLPVSELGTLHHLHGLYLNDNGFTGPIMTGSGQLERLHRLSWLFLNNNFFTGTLSGTELCSLTNLRTLNLHNNSISGSIPTQVGCMVAARLFLSNNKLTGTIPSELGHATALTEIYFQNNSLTGSIPSEICSLTQLSRLYLGDNALTGRLPTPMRRWRDLAQLSLAKNKLTGSLPRDIGSMTALESLALSENSFVGPIPVELGKLSALTSLSLNNNRLSGTIPTHFGFLSAHHLEALLLNTNSLTGPIPSQLGQLTKLWQLYLHENYLDVSFLPTELSLLTTVNLNLLLLQEEKQQKQTPTDSEDDNDNDDGDDNDAYQSGV
jgi:Leucine-rich repeat (LRR) protein